MLVLEHDAKELLAGRGVPVPAGVLADAGWRGRPGFPAPWVVKAQVPAGGRGKAGGIRRVGPAEPLEPVLRALIGRRIRGHLVSECRIEAAVPEATEAYLGLSIDASAAAVRVLVSERGGVDVERAGAVLDASAAPDAAAVREALAGLARRLPETLGGAVVDAGGPIAAAFFELEATLLEINPLFVARSGGWVAGDVRLAVDANALVRQPALRELVGRRAAAYPEAAFKFAEGFDLVVIDPEGEIGLVTTGAGLSMKLIDDLIAAGARPYNFCDVRSGQMRGDPARLVGLLRRMAAAPRLRAVLVNIFAGITELGEFAGLLVTALRAVPELAVPVVVRLVGHGEERAQALLGEAGLPVIVERDLEAAVAAAVAVAAAAGAGRRDA